MERAWKTIYGSEHCITIHFPGVLGKETGRNGTLDTLAETHSPRKRKAKLSVYLLAGGKSNSIVCDDCNWRLWLGRPAMG